MQPLRSISQRGRRGPLALAAVTVAAVALSACGSSYGGSSSTGAAAAKRPAAVAPSSYGAATRTTSAPATATAALAVHAGEPGTFLVDGEGRAVYLFEQDTSDASTCEAACASAWPPVTATSAPKAGAGLRQGLVGTVGRADGSTQVTYGGHPLYRFAGDQKPGEATGQGVTAFGAPWYVVRPSGEKLDDD